MLTKTPPPPPPPQPKRGRTSAPHGARRTAAGAAVTHDAMFLPAGRRQRRGLKLVCAVTVSERDCSCVCAKEGHMGSVKWVREEGSQGLTVGSDGMGVRNGPFCPQNSPRSMRSSGGCNNALIVPWMGVIELFTQAWKGEVRPRGCDQACSEGRTENSESFL